MTRHRPGDMQNFFFCTNYFHDIRMKISIFKLLISSHYNIMLTFKKKFFQVIFMMLEWKFLFTNYYTIMPICKYFFLFQIINFHGVNMTIPILKWSRMTLIYLKVFFSKYLFFQIIVPACIIYMEITTTEKNEAILDCPD